MPCCANEGVGVTVYNPLAAGLLTGKHNAGKGPASDTRFGIDKIYYERYWAPVNFTAVDHLKKLPMLTAGIWRNFLSPGCSVIRWSLPPLSGLLPRKQLEENLGALDVKLTPEETKACDDVWRCTKIETIGLMMTLPES